MSSLEQRRTEWLKRGIELENLPKPIGLDGLRERTRILHAHNEIGHQLVQEYVERHRHDKR